MTRCANCGCEIPPGGDEIICERNEGEIKVFGSERCLDEHIKRDHPDRPIDDRPDLLPLGRKT